ncbi:MAG TPA: GDP-mannose 4,6-dehydratase, partial [Dissulfurispiraceae bacterium]|nr:GDP-mannose 4,6-dehydratase [Dissulfurispiraceae bacterium]
QGLDEKGVDRSSGKTVVEIDPRFFRPAEVDVLIGDYSRAKAKLGWEPKTTFNELLRIMVQHDMNVAQE